MNEQKNEKPQKQDASISRQFKANLNVERKLSLRSAPNPSKLLPSLRVLNIVQKYTRKHRRGLVTRNEIYEGYRVLQVVFCLYFLQNLEGFFRHYLTYAVTGWELSTSINLVSEAWAGQPLLRDSRPEYTL